MSVLPWVKVAQQAQTIAQLEQELRAEKDLNRLLLTRYNDLVDELLTLKAEQRIAKIEAEAERLAQPWDV